MTAKTSKKVKNYVAQFFLLIASVFFLAPFIWMVSTSLKALDQVYTFPPEWIPNPFVWQNYVDAMDYIPFFTYLKNTVLITGFSTLGVVLTCPLVAYSFAKLNWKGRDSLFFITIAVMMIPGQVTMIPLFLLFEKLNWIGTALPLVIPAFFGVPFYIFLLRQFFLGLPNELRMLQESTVRESSERIGRSCCRLRNQRFWLSDCFNSWLPGLTSWVRCFT